MRFFADARKRWFLLALAWVVLVLLGFGGFVEQSRVEDSGRSVLDNLYLTMQLAVLSYGDTSSSLNWRLEVARFAAPLMATGTLIQAASVVFRDQFERLRLRRFRGHTVVCGLGVSGTRLALALAAEGRQVVGVDPNPAGPGLATLRAHDIPCLAGDPTDGEVLHAVRLDRASGLVALCATDALNVAVAMAARRVPRPRRAVDLRCTVHLDDAELTEFLRGSGLGGDEAVRVEFFNLHDRGARALLAEHLVLEPGTTPHLVVVGLGQLGRSLVVAAAQQWAEVGAGRLVVTVVDREASSRWLSLGMQHPGLVDVVDVELLSFDVEAPTPAGLAELTERVTLVRPALVAVVLDDESLALATGLFLQRLLDDGDIPVVVRTRGDQGLGEVVASEVAGEPRFPGLELFPLLDRACSPALIEGGVREQLARAVYEDHLARAGVRGVYEPPWQDLSDEQRELSREAADGLVDQVAAIGFELMPLRHWGGTRDPFSAAEVEALAESDHDRWRERREAAGWRYGEVRDEAQLVTPQLVPWKDLAPKWREYNLSRIRAMPVLLARAGFELAREEVRVASAASQPGTGPPS